MTTQPNKTEKHPYAPEDDITQPKPQDKAPDAPTPPNPELPTVAQAKKHCCDKLTKIFTSELMNERLMKMAGGDASRVAKNLTAFLSLITQDDGGPIGKKKYLMECSISSLTTCFLESMNMQLPFDSRQLVSIVIYDYEAELDISYKGFINALCKHYQNAFVDAKVVFLEDKFSCKESGGKVVFEHEQADPFVKVDPLMKNVRGAYCYFTYTHDNGEKVERMVRASKDDLWTIRSKAKTKNVWDEFTGEQILKAIIRRASKIPFAAIDLDIDIMEVANKHFQLEDHGPDRIKRLMQSQEEVVNGKPSEEKKDNVVANEQAKKDMGTSKESANNIGNVEPENKITDNESRQKQEVQSVDDSSKDVNKTQHPQTGTPAQDKSLLGDQQKTTQPTSNDKSEKITDAEFTETVSAEKTPLDTNLWDGKSVYTGAGKSVSKQFVDANAALVYVKRIISQHKTKVSRIEIIKGNPLLVAALIKSGAGEEVSALHQLADQGE